MRNLTKKIKSLCAACFDVLPSVRTDFEALPSKNIDQNCVDEWLEKVHADIGRNNTEAAFSNFIGNEIKAIARYSKQLNQLHQMLDERLNN